MVGEIPVPQTDVVEIMLVVLSSVHHHHEGPALLIADLGMREERTERLQIGDADEKASPRTHDACDFLERTRKVSAMPQMLEDVRGIDHVE